MNLVSPPTDSIYKFSAIAGLILFGYMGYFILYTPNEYQKKESELQAELSSLKARMEIFRDKLIYGVEPSLDSTQIKVISDFNIDSLSSPRIRNIIFKLPIPIQVEYENIFEETSIWASKWHSNEFQRTDHRINEIIFIALFYLGEIFCVWGILKWYYSIQKPNDKETIQRLLRNELFESCCQSCSKEILFISERGTESNGELSKIFCKDCYIDGSYTEPELTFEIASQRLLHQLNTMNYSQYKKCRASKKLERVSRWSRLKKW